MANKPVTNCSMFCRVASTCISHSATLQAQRWIKTQCKSKGGSVIPEVAVMKTVATVLLLLGVSALVLVPANTMRSKHHGRGYEKKCANSTDQAECLRRVKVCHSVLGRLEHLKDCANQLNIELPPETAGKSQQELRQEFFDWARSNPGLSRPMFACVRQRLNSGGLVNITAVLEKVTIALVEQNEPELLEKLVDRINFCPPESSFRAFYKCAWQGCTTP
ncbi:uncharacterized protein LOC121871190 [Homarus americanus]|uniref:uncharacterized protein LOC121871190 n=1 Tax=Homarus americanus TaxID=6706 RepID=UPI001C4907E7|nr:uncharacterized protein LOC121871190 [Homarus americanus]